jgi:hypothetical protein
MTTAHAGISQRTTARVAGLFYLILAVFGGFAQFFARVNLIVPGDSAATVKNIAASESLFRFGLVSDLIAQTFFLLLILALYKLLKPVNKTSALIMFVLAVVAVPVACVNLVNQYAVLLLLSGADYLSVFETHQLHALAMLFLNLHDVGYTIAHVFFGIWLFPLGFLVFKSGFLPRFFGIMLMLAAFGYVTGVLTSLLFPDYAGVIEPVYIQPALAEISFALWLLIRGVKVQEVES